MLGPETMGGQTGSSRPGGRPAAKPSAAAGGAANKKAHKKTVGSQFRDDFFTYPLLCVSQSPKNNRGKNINPGDYLS